MRDDLRPYWIKRVQIGMRTWYCRHYLRPHFEALGRNAVVMKPRYIEVSGPGISIGCCATIVAEPDQRVRLSVWGRERGAGEIVIGDYVLITPGVRISACDSIRIGHSCMIAHGAYITDSDWHGLYDRIAIPKKVAPVTIGNNVWIGDRATVLKGVTIGDNSVVAAGAIVTRDVPADVVVAGNPAREIHPLDGDGAFYTRAQYLENPLVLWEEFDAWDRELLKNNKVWKWVLSEIWPRSAR